MTGALGTIDANIKVAIKEFFMRDINGRSDATVTSGSKGGIYDEYKRKFTREALNLSKLQHPNIIKVIESFEANNTMYYVMEYIGGGSLDDYIAKNNGLKEDEAIRIIKQIGTALSFMHDNKMLHLDLKPSNIMMKESGEVVLIDFGLSKQYDEKGEPESSTKVGAGTPGYAPIEQANYREGKGFPVTMDVYALGATMFKMLTGIRPPEASDILNDGFPLYELQEHQVSERTSASIAKAMAPTKKDRYNSVENFIKSFEEECTLIDVEITTEKAKEEINNLNSSKNNPTENVDSHSYKKNQLFEKVWLSLLCLTHLILLCGALSAAQFNSNNQDWFATYHRLLSISWFLGLLGCGFLLKKHTKSGMTILFISLVAPFVCDYVLKPDGFNGFTEMVFQFAAFIITYAVILQAREGGNQVIKFLLCVGIIAILVCLRLFYNFTILNSNITWCTYLIISFLVLYTLWPKTFKNSITSLGK